MKEHLGLQKAWGGYISSEMSLEGVGGVVFILGILAGREGNPTLALAAMIAGLVAVLLATLILIVDLGSPLRAFFVFLNPRSPMSLGAYMLVFFSAFGVLTTAFWVFNWPKGVLYLVVAILASFFAIAVVLYPGFLMGIAKGVPFWHRSLLPVVFSAMAAAGGLALFLALLAVLNMAGVGTTGMFGQLSVVAQWTLGAVVVAALIMASVMFLVRATPTGVRSVYALTSNGLFWWGVVLGVLLPVIVLAFGASAGRPALALVVGIFTVAGWFVFRHLFIVAGAMEPMQVMGAEIMP
ncbi:MAG: NrfD/PsrC family molybdoenzyme membrane anchor subunit [Chloroflexota bacterium]|nr:NrfD/PsrC family molybdoenzyme membrane anchor subunit [Chloroflexota bacterium]